jgi:hypothetical protein
MLIDWKNTHASRSKRRTGRREAQSSEPENKTKMFSVYLLTCVSVDIFVRYLAFLKEYLFPFYAFKISLGL